MIYARPHPADIPGTVTNGALDWRNVTYRCASGHGTFALVRRPFRTWTSSAPDRIRTCAHGSGGRCSIP
jgi:hypothetical protein